MIKEKEIEINISYRNITHYKKLGYNTVLHNKLEIKVNDLPLVSHQKVTAVCDVCGGEKTIQYCKYLDNKNRGGYYGCKKCSNKKREITSLERFGVSNYAKTDECKNKVSKNNIKKYGVKTTLLEAKTKEKIQKTIFNKYGVDEILSSKDIREKGKKTMIKKYGVEHALQSDKIYNKLKKTNLNKYNFEHPMKNKDIKEKVIKTNIKKYGHASPLKSVIVQEKLSKKYKLKYNYINIIEVNGKILKIKCDCGEIFEITKMTFNHKILEKVDLCPKCNPPTLSNNEIKILNFINNNYDNEILNNKKNILPSLELDIYIPKLKLAFEFNGVYWHNELHKEKNYHLNKTELCEEKDIQLIHIWEDNWIYKQDIVKSMILNKLGKTDNKVYARKTEVKEVINNKLIRKFLDKNHIQGFVGSNIKLGLFFDNELVSLMTFGKRRVAMGKKSTNDDEYELLRFCNKLNTNVIGGASKLFKYFIKFFKPKEIITYADRAHSQGKIYEILGFKSQGKTQPNYYYVIGNKRTHRFNFRKNILIKEGYDSNKTEHQIMIDRKIYRIYDSGNLKFSFKPFVI